MHHIQHHLAAFIDKPFEETSTLYAGINHLTFIYDFRWNGHGRVAAGAREGSTASCAEPADPDEIGNIFADGTKAWNNPFSWEIFRRYGAFPAAEDRHVTEFFPERWAQRQVLRQDARRGRVLGAGDPRVGREPLPVDGRRRPTARPRSTRRSSTASSGEQEQLIAIIRSVLTDSREMFSCNVVNNGAVPGLPDDAALEIPGVATGARHPADRGAGPLRCR